MNVVQLAPVRTQHEVSAPEILKESGLFSYKAPIRGGHPRATPANTNHGEGEKDVTHSQMVNTLNGLKVSEFMAFLPSLKQH